MGVSQAGYCAGATSQPKESWTRIALVGDQKTWLHLIGLPTPSGQCAGVFSFVPEGGKEYILRQTAQQNRCTIELFRVVRDADPVRHALTAEPRQPCSKLDQANDAFAKGQLESALALYREALPEVERTKGEKHPETAQVLSYIGICLSRLGLHQLALDFKLRAARTIADLFGERSTPALVAQDNVAISLLKLNRQQEALTLQLQVVAALKAQLGARHLTTIEATGNLAGTLRSMGRIDEALVQTESVATSIVEQLGPNDYRSLSAQDNLAGLLMAAGQAERGIALREQLVERFVKALGDKHLDTKIAAGNLLSDYLRLNRLEDAKRLAGRFALTMPADSASERKLLAQRHLQQGTAILQAGSTKDALSLLAKAVDLLESPEVGDIELLAKALLELGRAQNLSGNGRQAVETFRRSNLLFERKLGSKNEITLIGQGELADVLFDLGSYEEAKSLQQQVLALRREVLGDLHIGTVTSGIHLARAYRLTGEPRKGAAVLGPILNAIGSTPGFNTDVFARAAIELALALSEIGQLTDARDLAQDAVKLAEAGRGSNLPTLLTARSGLAQIYLHEGRIGDATLIYEDVLSKIQSLRGQDDPGVWTVMANLAIAYQQSGRLGEALGLVERILSGRLRTLGADHPATLMVDVKRAVLLASLGRTTESAALMDDLIAREERVLGPLHQQTLDSMIDVALNRIRESRFEEAARLLGEVSTRLASKGGPAGVTGLRIQQSLGTALQQSGQLELALEKQKRTLQEMRTFLGDRHLLVQQEEANMAQTLDLLNRPIEAIAIYKRLIDPNIRGHAGDLGIKARLGANLVLVGRLDEAMSLGAGFVLQAEAERGQLGLTPADRRSVFGKVAEGFRTFATAHARSGSIEEAFRLSELGKARTLLESMTAGVASTNSALPEAERTALASLSSQEAAMNTALSAATGMRELQQLEARLNDLSQRREATQRRLQREFPRYRQLSVAQVSKASEVASTLTERGVAISYLVRGHLVSALVIGSDGKPQFRDLGAVPNLNEVVEAIRRSSGYPGGLQQMAADDNLRAWKLPDGSFRLLTGGTNSPSGALPVRDIQDLVVYLSTKLVAPLTDLIGGKPVWVISPDGPLALLPFELLRQGAQGVIETHEIHYAQSLSVYALARQKLRDNQQLGRPHDLLAFGNPQYQATGSPSPNRKGSAKRLASLELSQLRDTQGEWVELPGTELEVNSLARIFPGSEVFLGKQATEFNLRALNTTGKIQKYRYIHFATHGFASSANPALSSIVLSLVDLAEGTDGFVTAAKLSGYDLRSDLTVLSACETAVGTATAGEGVMGLPFSLLVAGSANTLLSLWPVDDDATALFMQSFYSKLKAGHSAAQSLAETKRGFLKHPKFNRPNFWAPFILIGAG